MKLREIVSQAQAGVCATALSLAMIQMSVGPTLAATAPAQNDLPSPGKSKHTFVVQLRQRS